MTHPARTALDAAIADALRGHRLHEYEGAAARLATAAKNYIDHVEAKRAEVPGQKVIALSQWIDAGVDDAASEAQAWHRVSKCAEEAGEAVAALLGCVGRNPRKGRTHAAEDLEKELHDVAVSALGAIAHLHDNDPDYDPVEAMGRALDVLLDRVGIGG